MNYEVDKKSFYEMLESMLNYVNGEGYVERTHLTYDDFVILGSGGVHKCIMEKYSLVDSLNNELFTDEKVIQSAKKYGDMFAFTTDYENETFKVTDKENEIVKLISPYIFEYQYLIFLPKVIEELVKKEETSTLVFDKSSMSKINSLFSEYKIVGEEQKNKALIKVREDF